MIMVRKSHRHLLDYYFERKRKCVWMRVAERGRVKAAEMVVLSCCTAGEGVDELESRISIIWLKQTGAKVFPTTFESRIFCSSLLTSFSVFHFYKVQFVVFTNNGAKCILKSESKYKFRLFQTLLLLYWASIIFHHFQNLFFFDSKPHNIL